MKRIFILFIAVMLLLVSTRAMAEPNVVWICFGCNIATSSPYNESEYNNTWTCFGCSIVTYSPYNDSEPNTTWQSFSTQIVTSTPYNDNKTSSVWQSFGTQISVTEILICNYFINVSINSSYVGDDLIDFPVLIPINSTISAKCDGGKSIRFNNSDNTTQLKYEIEGEWNSSNTNYVWVKIPIVDNLSNTLIWIRYNNSNAIGNQQPSSVWDSNYIAVWHMSESPVGAVIDSTIYGNNLTSTGSMTADNLVDGKIGKAIEFDGIDDYLYHAADAELKPTEVTLMMWGKIPPGEGDNLWTIGLQEQDKWSNYDSCSYGISYTTDTPQVKSVVAINGGNGQFEGAVNVSWLNDSWCCGAMSYETGHQVAYINGTNEDDITSNELDYDGTTNLYIMASKIGTGGGINRYQSGTIDEVHISDIVRNASWMNASFHSQNQTTNFLIWEEINGSGSADIDTSVAPDIWNIGNIILDTCCQNNFTFWQNGTTLIDITIGISGTNYTFVNYTEWLANNGHDRFYGNVTNNSWSTETNIEVSSTTLINQSFTGEMLFGVRLWIPRTITSQKNEDFDIVLTVIQST